MNVFQNQHPADALRLRRSQLGEEHRLAEHFAVSEIACKDGADVFLVHPALLLVLETVRRHFCAPITVNSAFRTREHNAAVGGSPGSKHLLGMAADIRVKGYTPAQVYAYLQTLNPGGLGIYDRFVHVDVFGQDRRFDYRTRK